MPSLLSQDQCARSSGKVAARLRGEARFARDSSDGFGLPQYVTTTYDHFGWEKQRTVVYYCHIYLTALRAARAMATAY